MPSSSLGARRLLYRRVRVRRRRRARPVGARAAARGECAALCLGGGARGARARRPRQCVRQSSTWGVLLRPCVSSSCGGRSRSTAPRRATIAELQSSASSNRAAPPPAGGGGLGFLLASVAGVDDAARGRAARRGGQPGQDGDRMALPHVPEPSARGKLESRVSGGGVKGGEVYLS